MKFDAPLISSWFANDVLFGMRRAAQSTDVEAPMRGANETALSLPSINSGIGNSIPIIYLSERHKMLCFLPYLLVFLQATISALKTHSKGPYYC